MQAMKTSVCDYIPTIAPWLINLLNDGDDEVRSNSAFALGVMAESGQDAVVAWVIT